jgi:hypothetical protein
MPLIDEFMIEKQPELAWLKPVSEMHIVNYRLLQATTTINWMMVCPGRMDHGPM